MPGRPQGQKRPADVIGAAIAVTKSQRQKFLHFPKSGRKLRVRQRNWNGRKIDAFDTI